MEINKSNKINFFKKIWYSISKINKYEELKREGLSASISYFINSILILCIFISVTSVYVHASLIKKAINYLDNNLPEFTLKENILNVQNEEATVLNSDEFKSYFGSVLVINPNIEQQEALDQYYKLASKDYSLIIFLHDKYIHVSEAYNPEIDSQNGVEEYLYSEELPKYVKEVKEEYNKQDVIEYFKNSTSYTKLFSQYYIIHIVTLGFLYILYIGLISLTLWGMTKLLKINWGFKNSLMNTIYGSTLSWILFALYMFLNYIIKLTIPYFDVISIALIFVYISILLYKDKKKLEEAKTQK